MVVCRPWLTLDAALKGVIAACVSRIGTMSNWVLSKNGQSFVIFENA